MFNFIQQHERPAATQRVERWGCGRTDKGNPAKIVF